MKTCSLHYGWVNFQLQSIRTSLKGFIFCQSVGFYIKPKAEKFSKKLSRYVLKVVRRICGRNF